MFFHDRLTIGGEFLLKDVKSRVKNERIKDCFSYHFEKHKIKAYKREKGLWVEEAPLVVDREHSIAQAPWSSQSKAQCKKERYILMFEHFVDLFSQQGRISES